MFLSFIFATFRTTNNSVIIKTSQVITMKKLKTMKKQLLPLRNVAKNKTNIFFLNYGLGKTST